MTDTIWFNMDDNIITLDWLDQKHWCIFCRVLVDTQSLPVAAVAQWSTCSSYKPKVAGSVICSSKFKLMYCSSDIDNRRLHRVLHALWLEYSIDVFYQYYCFSMYTATLCCTACNLLFAWWLWWACADHLNLSPLHRVFGASWPAYSLHNIMRTRILTNSIQTSCIDIIYLPSLSLSLSLSLSNQKLWSFGKMRIFL